MRKKGLELALGLLLVACCVQYSSIQAQEDEPLGTGWRQVAYYNMSNLYHTCPAGWHYHPAPARGCGRMSHETLTCDSAFFPVPGGTYTQVCGRVLGYQFGFTDGFRASHENNSVTLDEAYVTGVSVTRGDPRQHVWTYAAGRAERRASTYYPYYYCPCEQLNTVFVPPYVGACYFCESGDNSFYGELLPLLFEEDVLWDGEGCAVAGRCCQLEGPLYFSTTLDAPVSDTLEARVCNYLTSQYSNVIVSHLELYVK